MRTVLAAMCVIALFVLPANAGTKNFGIGVLAGEPTGLSVKKWLGELTALDAALAWSFVDDTSFQIHADYLRHVLETKTKPQKGRSMFYYGAGGRIKFRENGGDDDVTVGLRIPFGVTYLSDGHPVDLFVELAPILNLVPETDMTVSGGAGVRYYLW